MAVTKIDKLTLQQLQANGVQALADRPNSDLNFGHQTQNAASLKAWFDKFPAIMMAKINEIVDVLGGDNAAEHIRIDLDEEGITNLQELIDAIVDGDLASILYAKPSVDSSTTQSVQAILNSFSQSLADHAEDIEELQTNAVDLRHVVLSLSGNIFTIALRNQEGSLDNVAAYNLDLTTGTGRLADAAVTTPKIADGAVTTGKLANASVTSEKLAPGAIDASQLADGMMTTPKIAAGAVTEPKLANGAVTTNKLDDGSVTTPKIASEAVTTEKIADEAVTADQIAPTAVETAHVKDSAITAAKIAASAVTADKIAAGAVVEAKLADALKGKVNGAIVSHAYNASTGVITFTHADGTTSTIDLPTELIVGNGSYYDEETDDLVLVLANSSTIRIPLDDLIDKVLASASSVTANPTLGGSEANLTGLEVSGTKYKVPTGTTVNANPTLAGTEASLAGLEVNGTKYKVPEPTAIEANPTQSGSETELDRLRIGSVKYKITKPTVPQIAVNPTLAGTEAAMTGLELNGTKYKMPTVSANPTLAGTETELEGLEVNGTKYKMPEGGGSAVVANPTRTASDPSLRSIAIDGSNYQLDTLWYRTSAPTAANPNGIKIVILPTEPATKYDGYLYIIIPEYTVTYIITNGSHNGAPVIKEGGSRTFTITPQEGYGLPESIAVSGADYTYNSETGVVTISNPTGNVTVSAECTALSQSYTVTVTCVNAGAYENPNMHVYGYDANDPTADIVLEPGDVVDVTVTSGQITLENTDGDMKGEAGTTTVTGGLTYASGEVWKPTYAVSGNGSITFAVDNCFVEGTQITLADYTTKSVEAITYDDELLVWDFYEGKMATAKPAWIMVERKTTMYKEVTLSDGTVLNLVGSGHRCHRLYNITKQKFLYANECVGDEVYKQTGEIVRVVSCVSVNKDVKYYNLTTEKYYDCFANGVLTGSRLNNMYPISEMRYISNERLISEEEEAERWAARRRIQKSR